MLFENKKGAENVVASLILFIAVMALATTTTIVFKNYMDRSGSAVAEQQTRNTDIIQTNFRIAIATYNEQTTTAYVKNTGSTRFEPEDIDLYIDGIRIPRNESNRSISVTTDTDTTNTGIWDPQEELEIQIFKEYTNSQTRTLIVSVPNGVQAKTEFST